MTQTLMGFDFGTKRIGMAIGQTETNQASPLQTITSKNNLPNWDLIIILIKKWQPQALVVGIPLNMDGSEQPMTARARHFAKTLHSKSGLPVHEAEERLTTIAAKEQIFAQHHNSKKNIDVDSMAAKIILASFLQTYQGGPPAHG